MKQISGTERQREFKERMYAAGYKQRIVWVPRKSKESISRSKFLKRFGELTAGWSSTRMSDLYATILGMIERRERKRKDT
jgi:hypothetical protein